MQKTIGMLAVLLVAQVMLTIGMSFTGPNLTAVKPDTPLLELGGLTADRLSIEGSDNRQLSLVREGEDWVLPDKGNFPADKVKVEHLLDRLSGLKYGLAVATSKGAQKRFKVSEDAFERKVTLAQGEEILADLYLGTSPGMRRVHARTSDDDAVYTVEFGIYDVPVNSEDWEDKSVLQIPRGEIEKIILSDLTLSPVPRNGSDLDSKQGENLQPARTTWSSDALAGHETLDQANADALAGKLSGLRIGAVLGTDAKPEYGLDAPVLVIGLQYKRGAELEYRLGKRDKENDYVLKVSTRPEYFSLPGYTGDALIKSAKREQLVAEVPGSVAESEVSSELIDTLPDSGFDESVENGDKEDAAP